MKHQPVKQGQTTTPGTPCRTLCEKCVGSLTSPTNQYTEKMQEKGPTVYRPYPRRLERLTICECHCKGSTFTSLSYFKTLNVGPFWDSNPRTPGSRQCGALPIELTRRRYCRTRAEVLSVKDSLS